MFSIAVIGVGTFLGECGVFARRAWGRGRGFLLRDDGEGSASNATAAWAAKLGMNLQSSTLKFDETGEPLPSSELKIRTVMFFPVVPECLARQINLTGRNREVEC
jgi:hypothetical protein